MNDLVDRITAVQTAHERTGPPLKCACGGREHYRCVCYTHEECECGIVTPYDEHAAHVAERIAEAMREDGIVGFVRNDAKRVPRTYTNADHEVWADYDD